MKRLPRARVAQAAELARQLNLRALEVRPDGSFRVELPTEGGDAWERAAKEAFG